MGQCCPKEGNALTGRLEAPRSSAGKAGGDEEQGGAQSGIGAAAGAAVPTLGMRDDDFAEYGSGGWQTGPAGDLSAAGAVRVP